MQHLGDNVSSNVDNFVFDGAKTSFTGSFCAALPGFVRDVIMAVQLKRFAILKKLLFVALADDKIRERRS